MQGERHLQDSTGQQQNQRGYEDELDYCVPLIRSRCVPNADDHGQGWETEPMARSSTDVSWPSATSQIAVTSPAVITVIACRYTTPLAGLA